MSLLLIIICLNTAGCWDSKDVDRLAFPIAASYDVHRDDPGKINQLNHGPLEEPTVDITVVYPNLSALANAKVTVETIPSSTVGYGRDKRGYTSPDFYVTGFNKVILAGEDLAAQGLYKHLESLYRFPEVSNNMFLALVEGRGEDVLKMQTDNADNIGTLLYSLVREPYKRGFMPAVTLHEFDVWQAPGHNPVLPMIKQGGVNQVFLSGLAVFKKDKLLAKLDLRQTRSLVLLRGISSQGYFPFALEDENKPGSVFCRNERKVKVERQGDVYVFKVEVLLTGIITEHPAEKPLDVERGKKIEDFIAAEVESDCQQIINTMQNEWKTDCIDISKYALAKWRRELEPQIDNEQFISKAQIQLEVKVDITNTGELR